MNRQEFLAWLSTVPEDEPIFCLRAKDNASVKSIEGYIHLCIRLRSPAAHIKKVMGFADEFEDWREANPDKCKVPD